MKWRTRYIYGKDNSLSLIALQLLLYCRRHKNFLFFYKYRVLLGTTSFLLSKLKTYQHEK